MPDKDKVLSSTLLKRLGEAVDGFPYKVSMYIVSTYEYPYDVHVFDTKPEALEFIEKLKPENKEKYGIFGPYTGMKSRNLGDKDIEVVKIAVTIKKGQETKEITYGPDTDALFLSMAAVEKFMIPYYHRVYGIERALEIQKEQ